MRRLITLSSGLFKVPIAGLRTLCADRRFRLAMIVLGGLLTTAFISIACALQFWLFPHINDYREELAARVGGALGVSVEVSQLRGDWSYLHPRVVLDDIVVFDKAHRPVVHLSQIAATLSWWDMLTGTLGFRRLSIAAPELDFRRDQQGHLFLVDLPLDGGGGFRVDTLLEQGELALTSEHVRWTDALRGAPTLLLRHVDLRLRSHQAYHRLDIQFAPPESLGSPFKGRIDWIGRSFADWRDWKVNATLAMKFVDLAGWRAWMDYPIKLTQGRGKADLKIETTGLDLTHVDGQLALTDIKVQLAPELDVLALQQARAQIQFQKRDEGRMAQLKLNGFSFTDAQGKAEPDTDLFIERQQLGENSGEDERVAFRASRLDLAHLRGLAMHLPISGGVRDALIKARPSGVLEGVKISTRIKNAVPVEYDAQTAFKGLSVRSDDGVRFVQNLSGKLDLNQGQGRLVLDSTSAMIGAPGILPVNDVVLNQVSGQIGWQRDAKLLSVKVKSLQLVNDDLQAVVNGNWTGKLGAEISDRDRAGTIDMKIVFEQAKSESAWKYVPLSASADISSWMKGAIASGSVSDFHIDMAGAVWDMPYGAPVPSSLPGSSTATGADGTFTLSFKAKDLAVKYADGYPPLKKLNATFVMNQNRIAIVASDGQINDMRFSSIKAEIPDVSAVENHLLISGLAQGPTEGAIRFLKTPSVAGHVQHFADDMSAQGSGKLDLSLDLNLQKPDDIKIKGQYDFIDSRLAVLPGAPSIVGLSGSIRFSESTLESTDLQGTWSGQPLSVRITTDDSGAHIEATGRANMAELRQHYGLPLFDQISGQAGWQARMGIQTGKMDLTLTSDLKGIASSLPEPFNKSASATLPLNVVWQNTGAATARRSDTAVSQLWRMSLGNALAGTLSLNNRGQIVRGRMVLGSGQAPAVPDQAGIQLESLRPINLDYWSKALGLGIGDSSKAASGGSTFAVSTVSIKAPSVIAFGRKFQDFRATVNPSADRTLVQMASKELQGDVNWYPPGKGDGGERGLLQGHLSRLDLTAASDTQSGSRQGGTSDVESLPDLAFRVDELDWQGKSWGRLNFRARNQKSSTGQSWRIDPFQLDGTDLKFSGRLNWVTRDSGTSRKGTQENMTALDFKMNSPQVGNLLTKLGYPGTVKRGTVQLDGQVSWPANPFGFDPGTLSGNFKMSAKNGQFAKMDPGVGRLLGLLSLQSIPQRLTLDFRDIFSEGLAFEAIEGRFDIRDGIMKTTDLEMDAPAARVLMRGETNLAEQTQDVRVTVRPALSNSVALGVTVLNPIIGAATFVTQKVLGDPLSKIFSYQYHITGTWSDPQVDKQVEKETITPTATPVNPEAKP